MSTLNLALITVYPDSQLPPGVDRREITLQAGVRRS